MAGRLLDEDAELAYAHAAAARRAAPRLGATREALGLAAYVTGRYAEALSELRAARRITGSQAHLPILADCERGLGRPERALELAASPEVKALDVDGRVEMRLVAAGARRDLGQVEAALVTLQGADLASTRAQPWTARLRYAYADALAALGRDDEALEWFHRAAEADADSETDAADRAAQLEGITFTDLEDDADALPVDLDRRPTGPPAAPGDEAHAVAEPPGAIAPPASPAEETLGTTRPSAPVFEDGTSAPRS
jgi:tetratricopeptide (TPR) repeat protein